MTVLVECKHQDKYTVIQMDDGKANALGFEMLAQLESALDQAEEAGKVVILCGRPGKFSAGFDLSVMSSGGDDVLNLLRSGANLSRRLLAFPAPVILAVSGHAIAMGGLLTLSADYRIGIHGAYKIGLNEVAIGMTLPYFGVELARERLAATHLASAVTLAKLYDSVAAVEAGFLDEVVSEEDLMPQAIATAETFAALDMVAFKNTKARTREALLGVLANAIEKELG